jgi:hypothetical protein
MELNGLSRHLKSMSAVKNDLQDKLLIEIDFEARLCTSLGPSSRGRKSESSKEVLRAATCRSQGD